MPDPTEKPVSEADIRHVAKLARLELPGEHLHRFTDQLASILSYVERISRVDVSGVEPMAHPLPLHNRFRPDAPAEALPLDKVLRNAPDSDGTFFKVPKVIGGDEDSAC